MDFNINKDSSYPILQLELINDGRNDYNKFFDLIQNTNIYFTMTDVVTGIKKIAKKKASIKLVENNTDIDEYYIIYKFTNKETNNSGRFIGQFDIDFLDGSGNLIVPINNTLYINILDQGIKK